MFPPWCQDGLHWIIPDIWLRMRFWVFSKGDSVTYPADEIVFLYVLPYRNLNQLSFFCWGCSGERTAGHFLCIWKPQWSHPPGVFISVVNNPTQLNHSSQLLFSRGIIIFTALLFHTCFSCPNRTLVPYSHWCLVMAKLRVGLQGNSYVPSAS